MEVRQKVTRTRLKNNTLALYLEPDTSTRNKAIKYLNLSSLITSNARLEPGEEGGREGKVKENEDIP